ncbi:DUF4440 domain-containing protein [Limosilactobacillus reuteri]|uniref:nuclear transport factor 2 family protein n=1 Tax=Limosilactobacillus reuteri TaxID=1598 RepID=UPI000B98F695|nr:nuclear transport factor 2 family protein [Limosilactobacillus reuteri]MCR1863708.1 nuclear transport factor 2 family protein [Limosilactobacillus reuteri]MCR1893478.1 nuclear transport factor 2 family protein [Limosilactobacillus reuteri]MRG63366.1 DUF4440 domain-containing protein [Limosilactobacillus reuteri]OYS47140.1 DUF4440 domain-containing protein [Limosilactobacillus reuteri]OYS48551.1 DUF4440 domain-containing protein [Limosilactobacillus reuteri]
MVQTNDEQAVAEVVRKQVSGMIDGDIEELRQIILPEAELVHVTEVIQTRDEWLRQIKLGRMHYFNNKEVLFQVTIDGEQAEVISRNEIDARIYGFRNTWPLQSRTQLVKRDDGQWKIISSQASMY